MTKERKVRISITIEPRMLRIVDELAAAFGISRNAWIVQTIGQQAFLQSKAYNELPKVISEGLTKISE